MVLIISLVFWGAEFSVKKGLEKETNVEMLAKLIKNDKSIAATIKGNEQPVILGVADSANDIYGINNKCRPQLVSKVNNIKSIVNYFNQSGRDYSFDNRLKVAQEMGIDNYTGTAEQNIKLINILVINDICVN